ncbi:MAG: hypothetical protein RL329_2164, partial [Bacteroidota bacterium]
MDYPFNSNLFSNRFKFVYQMKFHLYCLSVLMMVSCNSKPEKAADASKTAPAATTTAPAATTTAPAATTTAPAVTTTAPAATTTAPAATT